MIVDPNYAICVYRDNPSQIIDYIKDALGFDVCVNDGIRRPGPGVIAHIGLFLLDNNKNPLIELYYCGYGAYKNCFYIWSNGAPRLMEDQYCVNYTPVSNIINRFLHVYHNYRRQQKIDHQENIRQAGAAYEV